jgi:hypothetical protein
MIRIEAQTSKKEKTLPLDVSEIREKLENKIKEEPEFAPSLELPVIFVHTFNEGRTLDEQFSTMISIIFDTPEEADEAKRIFDFIRVDNSYKEFRLVKGIEIVDSLGAHIGM